MKLLNRKFSSVPIVYQSEEAECGLACLSMLVTYFGGNGNLQRLRSIYQSTRGGIGVNHLIKFSALVGLRLIPQVNFSITQLKSAQLPCIGLWENNHYVVIISVTQNYLVLHDPAIGFFRINITDAKSKFSNLILEPRIIPGVFEVYTPVKSPFFNFLDSSRLSDVGTIFTTVLVTLVILASVYQIGSAQIQDVFFDWIVQMDMVQWAVPLGYTQIIIGVLASGSLLAISLLVANKFTELSFNWNTFIYRRLIRLPESYFLDRRSGDIIAKFNNADQILKESQASIVNLVVAFVNLLILFVILGLTALPLLLLVVISICLAFYLSFSNLSSQVSSQEATQQAQAYSEKVLYDMITDFEQIRIEGREHYYLSKLNQAEIRRLSRQNYLNYIFGQQQMWLSMIDSSISILILIAAAFIIMQGQMTLGQYAALDLIVGISLSPMMNISGVIKTLQQTKIAFTRLSDIVQTPLDSRFNPDKSSYQLTNGSMSLQLSQVSFKYSLFSDYIYNNVSCNFTPADFPVFIQGNSGSGKTTLAKLLSGRLPTSGGSVSVFGNSLSNLNSSQFSSLISLVDGNPYIINGSLLNNILLKTQASVDDLFSVAQKLSLRDLSLFVDLNRFISDPSKELSPADLTVIHLLRVLLSKPKLIIFDNILSAIPAAKHHSLICSLIDYNPHFVLISQPYQVSSLFSTKLSIKNGKIS